MLHLKQKSTKKQLAIFSFCLFLILLTGCVKQKQVAINNPKSELVNKNEDKKNNTNATENKTENKKDATDNIETNTEENNEEETKITWKKYTNSLYGFSFEYPDYLKVTADESCDDPSIGIKGCWVIGIESPDYLSGRVPEGHQGAGILTDIAGFHLYISTAPVKNMTFEEFRDSKQRNIQFQSGEWREINSRKFFIDTTPKVSYPDQPDNFDQSISTLYNSNLIIGVGIYGTKENKKEMEMILNHFMETLE